MIWCACVGIYALWVEVRLWDMMEMSQRATLRSRENLRNFYDFFSATWIVKIW